MTLDVEHWWNDTDGDTGVLDKNLFPSIRNNSVHYLGIYTAFRRENNNGFEISTVVEMPTPYLGLPIVLPFSVTVV